MYEKTERVNIDRYYILTTYKNTFESEKKAKEVKKYLLQVQNQQSLDIIVNGVLTTIKYYLRMIDDYTKFLESYTVALIRDAKNSTEVKSFHIEKWNEILKGFGR